MGRGPGWSTGARSHAARFLRWPRGRGLEHDNGAVTEKAMVPDYRFRYGL